MNKHQQHQVASVALWSFLISDLIRSSCVHLSVTLSDPVKSPSPPPNTFSSCVSVELRVAPSFAGSGTPDGVRPHQPSCGPSSRRQHHVHAKGCRSCFSVNRSVCLPTTTPSVMFKMTLIFCFKAQNKLQELLRHHVFSQAMVTQCTPTITVPSSSSFFILFVCYHFSL